MNTLSTSVRTIISLALLVGGAVGFFLLGKPVVPTRPPDRGTLPVVRVVTAEAHRGGIPFEVDRVVVPFREIELAAQVSGRIEYKSDNCRTGRAVRKGDLLLRIEQRDYELEVARLQEELKQADAMIEELNVELATTENQIELAGQQLEIDVRQLQRNVDLRATQAASESELDVSRRAELTARNSLQTLLDQKKLLAQRAVRMQSAKVLVKANLDKALLSQQRTEIFAPLDGVVIMDNVEQDSYVQLGSPLLTLQDTSQLDVTCKLHMRQMNWLWQAKLNTRSDTAHDSTTTDLTEAYDFPETPAVVTFQLGDVSYHWQGLVNRYDGSGIDNQTRMIPCRVHVDKPLEVTVGESTTDSAVAFNPPTLMTGMFVKILIKAQPPIALLKIPQTAIQPGNIVWTVTDGKLKRNIAKIAHSNERWVIAHQYADGLQTGDAVVVSPLATPISGLAVNALKPNAPIPDPTAMVAPPIGRIPVDTASDQPNGSQTKTAQGDQP
jgi:multidrug efflux pump subunit AcrA (membrane-fusion protein)